MENNLISQLRNLKINRRVEAPQAFWAFALLLGIGLSTSLSLTAQPALHCLTPLETLGQWDLRKGVRKAPQAIELIEATLKEIVEKRFDGDPMRLNTNTLLRAQFLSPQGSKLTGQSIMLHYWRAVVALQNPALSDSPLMNIRDSRELTISQSESLDYFRAKFWPAKANAQ